jgi:aspartyl-tRNA(Asn)/glutamyl-tRNA(Gln) amidotransferase subunit A
LHNLSVKKQIQGIRDKEFSARELTQHYLDRIEKYNPKINAFITTHPDHSRNMANNIDLSLPADMAPLLGIPVAHKDIFCTKGIRTTCGSKMLSNFISPYDATIIQSINNAGAVSLGKTNMDEFAMGSSNETSFYGNCLNPWDVTKVPGGSSGGSAAAVAARLAPIATATDTGGSIRQPAAFCGVTGIKPTYGRISRYGMIAFASSLDQAGFIGRSAEDISYFLDAASVYDSKDSTSLNVAADNISKSIADLPKEIKIGIMEGQLVKHTDPRILEKIENAIKLFSSIGIKIIPVKLPYSTLAIPTYYVIAPAEASSNLSRFDGVRFGYRTSKSNTIDELYEKTRSEGFGSEVKRRILIGSYVLSAGFYDAYYVKAQKIRRLISNDYDEAFKEVDLILSPTTPSLPFSFGEKSQDPISMYQNDAYTIGANLAGLPGVSFPIGFIDQLPVGAQLVGKHLSEKLLLQVTHAFQKVSNYHDAAPIGFGG